MKRAVRMPLEGCRSLVLASASLVLSVVSCCALTEANPYAAIAGRNVFALKPPTPVTPINTAPPVAASGVELQGFTTILGRPQVLLKLKIPPRPPEPAKDRSLVMDQGQREGEVEVLEIDAYAGTVKLKNQGSVTSLNLKDNAAKPTPGAALPLPSPVGAPGGVPGSLPPPPNVRGPSTAPADAASATLPTRNLRSSNSSLGTPGIGGINSPNAAGSQADAGEYHDPVHQAAAIEVMAGKNRDLIEAGKMAPPPITGVSH
ncbi:MAG: hypothetical protein QM813_12425 [Verrucomicrobiota bacterium]